MTERERIRLQIGAGFCACKGDEIGACDYHMATDVTKNAQTLAKQLTIWGRAKEKENA